MIDHPAAVNSFAELPGNWPDPASLSPIEPNEGLRLAQHVFLQIIHIFTAPQDYAAKAIQDLFLQDSFWRDHVALTWSLRTFHSQESIANQIPDFLTSLKVVPDSLQLVEDEVAVVHLPLGIFITRMPVTFKTSAPAASCTAVFKLVRTKEGHIRIFTVTTALQELEVFPWKSLDIRQEQEPTTNKELPKALDVLVIGAGHSGLNVSAYFKALGLNFATIDKYEEVGDNWAKRYDSATLHTTKKFSELPYIPYPQNYPQYLRKHHLAEFYKDYVKKLDLPVHMGRSCRRAVWDVEQECWNVSLLGKNGKEELQVKSLVFATGIIGHTPYIPEIPCQNIFKGSVLHSARYTNAARWKDKRVIVIGASTTGCDVALDATKAGASSVTLVQRGEIRLYPQDHVGKMLDTIFTENMPLDFSDTLASEDPTKLTGTMAAGFLAQCDSKLDSSYYEDLRNAGFKIKTFGAPMEQILCHGGRHYIDVGTCEAIRKGLVTVKSDAAIQSFTKDGLLFDDKCEIKADVVCFATGFEKDLRKVLVPVLGQSVCSQLKPLWGLDSEGEVRGVWRPSGRDHLWFQGGELQTQRYYGKFLAMQVAAEIAGVRPKPDA